MEWEEITIDICCDLIAGYAFKSKDFGEFDTKVIRIGDITPPFVHHDSAIGVNLANYDHRKIERYKIKYNDFVLAMTGATIGKVGRYISDVPSYVNQRVLLFKSKEGYDHSFIYYTINSYVFSQYVLNHIDSESAQPNISANTISKFSFKIPANISDQRKIAGILSALDAKIENNNKINANLEAQAEALFKSWFVDFTPFKDQPFVDSELGPIPQGWKVGKLGDYVEIKRGGSPRPIQKFLASQGLNWLKISDATSTQSPFIFNIKEKIIIDGLKKTVFLKAGSLVLSNSATPCIPKFLSIDSCIHDGWLYFPHSQLPENYLYLFFKLMRNNLVSKANGSVFLNLKTDIVKNQVFAFSGEEIYNSFDKIIAPLFKEIENLTYETFQLSALRDTLLPKLMSGEIKL